MKNKLHILFLASWYPSRVLKGNGDFIKRHAEAVALKHPVTILHVITDENTIRNLEISDKTDKNIRTLIAYVKPIKNKIKKWKQFKDAYYKLLEKVDPFDVVHVHKLFSAGYIAYELKKKKNIPYIITEHHTIYHKPYNKQISFFEKYLSKKIVKNADFVCPVSNNLGEAMRNFGLKGNYTRVPNVVNTDRFKPKKNKNTTFNLLHVSSMAKVKNIEGILNVIKQLEKKLNTFTFNFIGGNAEDFLPIAKEKGLNTTNLVFKNYLSHDEMNAYYQNANVLILFSDVENLPCVILESFACGTPVISTNVGGIAEYFPDDFGLLITTRNEQELIDAILKLKTDFNPASPQTMYAYVQENFSEEAICNNFSELYYKALKN